MKEKVDVEGQVGPMQKEDIIAKNQNDGLYENSNFSYSAYDFRTNIHLIR